MEWGLAQEWRARAAYEVDHSVEVEQAGFVLHPHMPFFGCSPDGLVRDDGMIEIKCPTTITHLEWIRAGKVPIEHPQMLAELACTGRTWRDFVSFDPRLPDHLQLVVVRYYSEVKLIKTLEIEVQHFNAEIDRVMAALPQAPQPIAIVLDVPTPDEFREEQPPLMEADCQFGKFRCDSPLAAASGHN